MARCQLDLSSPTGSPAPCHSLPSSCLSPASLITFSPKMPHCSNRVLAAQNVSGRRREGENGAMRHRDNDCTIAHDCSDCTMPSPRWGSVVPQPSPHQKAFLTHLKEAAWTSTSSPQKPPSTRVSPMTHPTPVEKPCGYIFPPTQPLLLI